MINIYFEAKEAAIALWAAVAEEAAKQKAEAEAGKLVTK